MIPKGLHVEQIVVGPLMSNCYIVWDETTLESIIIDPGDNPEKIIKIVENFNLTVKAILATHGHFDHVGGVATLKTNINAEFLAHKRDFPEKNQGEITHHPWGIKTVYVKPDRYIDEGDVIYVGKYQFKVLYTPGHSPGSICFLHDHIIFVGDVLFQGGIGRTDFHNGSFEQLSKSIKTRLYNLPNDTMVYTGHGPSTTIGDEKQYNPFVRVG
jgi:glyoxylase-like metal-dependent hydrolase (beta-lactamase superfamily II)